MRKKIINPLRSPRTLKCLMLAGGAIFSTSVWGDIVQTSLNFATDPGWIGLNNLASPESFGYSNTNNNGLGAGEIGGFIQRHDPSTGGAYYAANVGTIAITQGFSFSGSIAVTAPGSTGVLFGYFNDPTSAASSSGGSAAAFMGINFVDAGDGNPTILADGISKISNARSTSTATLTVPSVLAFTFYWDPSTNTMSGKIGDSSVTADLTTFLANQTIPITYNRFGIFANPKPNDTHNATVFFDNLSFSYNNVVIGPTQSSWNVDSNGNWLVTSNWQSAVPNLVDAVATFSTAINSPRVVYADQAITVGTIAFDSPNEYLITGAGSIALQSATTAGITVAHGSHEINIPLFVNSNAAITVNSGASLLIADPVAVASGKTLTESGNITFESTIIMAPASAMVLASSPMGGNALTAQSLSMSPDATIDITNNSAVVTRSSVAALTASVKSGYNNGAWNGSGIISSIAAADPSHRTGIGIIEDASGGAMAKFAYFGDANLDGSINSSDFVAMASHFNATGQYWAQGDFNYDGVVNALDFNLLATNFGLTNAPALAALVPEPVSLGMMGTLMMMCVARRRRP